MMEKDDRKAEFCSMISRHLSESRSDLINRLWVMARRMNTESIKDMQIIVDKEVKRHKEDSLSELFGIVFNADMRRHFPEIDDISPLKLSDLNKCILLMSILGFSASEMADFLLSTPHSIQTMMLNIRKKYPGYAGHLTK